MATVALRGLAASALRQLVALLDAWSLRIAKAHAEKRRQAEAVRALKAGGNTPRWPGTWHD